MSTALQKFTRRNKIRISLTKSNKNLKTEPSNKNEESSQFIYSRARNYSIPLDLPNLTPRLMIKEQGILNNIYKNRKFISRYRYELKPLKRPQQVRLLRPSFPIQGVNEIKMISSRPKLSGQYQTHIENIKLVQKLLTVKPSKQVSKSEHKLFYKEHKKHYENMKVHKKSQSVSVKKKNKTPWVDISHNQIMT